jgi:TRAP-type C4-dicarboxylate transport system permease small subunit
MNALRKTVTALANAFGVVGCVALVAMIVLAAANMILRAVWAPIPGSYELIGFLCALGAGMGLGYTQLAKGHVAVTIVTDRFSPRAVRVVEAVSHVISAGLFGCAAWQTARWGVDLARQGELSETLRIPFYPVVIAVALGFAVLALTLLLDFIVLLGGREGRAA